VICPDDGSELSDDVRGVSSCRRCQGHAISGEAFSKIHLDIKQMLRAEQDRKSGAYAHVRLCPRCGREMLPLRMGQQLAWLDSCDSCEVLWVEKLDRAVIERLERRKTVTSAVESLAPEERRHLARDIAYEMADDQRQLRVIKAIRELLYGLTGW
jgi:Zn-finger nucleic acid-binding protein